jgi:hypothetical protein
MGDDADKAQPARKADLTAISEPMVNKTLEPRHLTILCASTSTIFSQGSFTESVIKYFTNET